MTEGRSRRSFRLKVEAIENAVQAGAIPEGMPVIAKLEDLRDWHLSDLARSWSSFSVAAPGGRNADLRRRFDKVRAAFVELQTGRKIRGQKPPKSKPVREWLIEGELDALLRQNADLIVRAQLAETSLRAKNTIIEALRSDNAELTAKLARITPLQRSRQ